MIRLLRWLIFGDAHIHKFVNYEKTKWTDGEGSSWTVYTRECEVCGTLKNFSNKL